MRALRPLSARPPFKMEALNPFRSMSLLLETSLSRCFFAMLGAGTPRPINRLRLPTEKTPFGL